MLPFQKSSGICWGKWRNTDEKSGHPDCSNPAERSLISLPFYTRKEEGESNRTSGYSGKSRSGSLDQGLIPSVVVYFVCVSVLLKIAWAMFVISVCPTGWDASSLQQKKKLNKKTTRKPKAPSASKEQERGELWRRAFSLHHRPWKTQWMQQIWRRKGNQAEFKVGGWGLRRSL